MAIYGVIKKEYMWKLGGKGTVCADAGTHNVVEGEPFNFFLRQIGAQGRVVDASSPAAAAAELGLAVEAPEAKEAVDYSSMLVRELRALCRERDIEGYSDMRKAELVAALSGD
jgi:hypothetical protein